MGKLIITEDEKKHILDLYGLLKEVEQTKEVAPSAQGQSVSELKMDERIEFGPGYYNPKFSYTSENGTKYNWDIESELKPGLDKIKEFLKSNPTGYVVGVTLQSGESQIPNNDVMSGRKRVEPNYLNTARLQTLKNYLTPIFESWKSEGINTDFTINEEKFIGETPWVGSVFCPSNSTKEQARAQCFNNYLRILKTPSDPKHSQVVALKDKYNQEQFFRVIINVNKVAPIEPEKTEPPVKVEGKCASGLKIRVFVPGHNCQNAEFLLFANQTLLYNSVGGMTANLNNANTSRGIPQTKSQPIFPPSMLNPGFGFLKNGDGTLGNYQYGNQNEKGDIGKGRSDTFTVTPEQSEEIVSIGGGFIDIWFVATTTNAHRDIPNVIITKPDAKEDVFNGKPQVIQGRLMRLDACGNKVLEMGTDSTVPNIDGYISQIVEERRNMITKESKGIFASIFRKGKLDGKSILLERSENMLKEMSDLLYYIYSQLSGEYRKQYDEYYKNPKNKNNTMPVTAFKPLPDEIRTDLLEKLNTYFFSFQKQIDESGDEENPSPSFRRVVPGEYSDRTINKGNLYGDIRLDLDKFYDGYDLLYYTKQGPKYGKYPLNTAQNWTGLLANIKKLKQWAFTV